MKPLILALIIFLPFLAFGQKENKPVFSTNYVSVKWNHLGGLISIENPMIVLGVENRKGKYGGCLQVGFGIPRSYHRDDTVSGYTSGFTIRADAKRYRPAKEKPGFDKILGLETFYTQYSYSREGYYRDTLISANVYQDTLVYKKKMLGLALIMGAQHRFSKHIIAQIYFGVGIKIKDVKEEGSIRPGYRNRNFENVVGALSDETGTLVRFATPLHFSIAWCF